MLPAPSASLLQSAHANSAPASLMPPMPIKKPAHASLGSIKRQLFLKQRGGGFWRGEGLPFVRRVAESFERKEGWDFRWPRGRILERWRAAICEASCREFWNEGGLGFSVTKGEENNKRNEGNSLYVFIFFFVVFVLFLISWKRCNTFIFIVNFWMLLYFSSFLKESCFTNPFYYENIWHDHNIYF